MECSPSAAAAGFADGEFDCVGVFAPFTLTALERPGSHVLFDSSDYPGTISDHIVVTPDLIEDRPEDVQALVDSWYATLDYIDAHPEESLEILAAAADITTDEYESLAEGTTIFSAEEALASFEDGDDTTSLLYTARLINPFLVDAGLTEEEASLDGLFDPASPRTTSIGTEGEHRPQDDPEPVAIERTAPPNRQPTASSAPSATTTGTQGRRHQARDCGTSPARCTWVWLL